MKEKESKVFPIDIHNRANTIESSERPPKPPRLRGRSNTVATTATQQGKDSIQGLPSGPIITLLQGSDSTDSV